LQKFIRVLSFHLKRRDKMKRINSRVIKLPLIVEAGGELATGLSPEDLGGLKWI